MKTSVFIYSGLSVALLGMTHASPVIAQETAPAPTGEETIALDEYIVTGETYAFGAQKLVRVTDDDLSRTQARDLKGIFDMDPSIMVGGGLPAAQKVYVRSVEDKLLNISIDGAPQGGYLSHHHGQYVVEPELLKQVEVEPGAGGATQGPGALAGAVRFETKRASDFLLPDQNAGVYGKVSYFSNGDGRKATAAGYGKANDNLSVIGAYTYFDIGDYKDGNGDTVDYTAHTQHHAYANLAGMVAPGHELSVGYEALRDNGIYRHRPNFAGNFPHPVAPNDPVEMDLTRDTFTAGYQQYLQNGSTGIKGTAYYTDYTIDRLGQYEMGYGSIGFDVHNRNELGEHTITYGADYRDDTLSFTGKGSVTGFAGTLEYQTIPDEKVRILGAYAQDNWVAHERLDVSFGARFDNYDYRDKDDKTFRDSGVSPNIGASFLVAEGLRINASYGLAFRGVTAIDSITANEGTISNADEIDPERAYNGELGFQYQVGGFSLSGTAYKQTIDNLIIDADFDSIRGNEGELEVTGYDLTAAYNIGGLTTSLAVSESDPELNGRALTDTDFGVGTAYGRTWNAYAGYYFQEIDLVVGWTINHLEEFDNVPEGIPAKPAYTVHHAFAQWQPMGYDRLVLTLTINNVFDEFFVDQATSGYNSRLDRVAGLPEPGRDVRIAAALKF